jgi:hypothetical protein
MIETLEREDLAEMLSILAGYFGATEKSKDVLKGWL